MRRHHFVDDPDLFDPATLTRWCWCGRKESNVAHQLPERSEVEREAEARRVGERHGGQ